MLTIQIFPPSPPFKNACILRIVYRVTNCYVKSCAIILILFELYVFTKETSFYISEIFIKLKAIIIHLVFGFKYRTRCFNMDSHYSMVLDDRYQTLSSDGSERSRSKMQIWENLSDQATHNSTLGEDTSTEVELTQLTITTRTITKATVI